MTKLKLWCGEHKSTPQQCAPIHAQREQWEAFEAKELARRVCPYSGEDLVRREYDDGPPNPEGNVMSCALCDCFGYSPEEVGT